MQETSLHTALKDRYAPDRANQEIRVDGYIIDAVMGDILVEIQTRNFSALRPKLAALLDRYPVRVVHPVALEKWIVRSQGDRLTRRISPRHGRCEDVFRELVYLTDWLAHPNFSLEVLLVRVEELRCADGKGSWRRGGVSIFERRLVDVVEAHLFTAPSQWLALLPQGLPDPFTNADLARCGRLPAALCSRATYSLRTLGLIQACGKAGRRQLFCLVR